jgi:hypothetical protein
MQIRPAGVGSSRHSGQTKIRRPISIGFITAEPGLQFVLPRVIVEERPQQRTIFPVFKFYDARAARVRKLRDREIFVYLRTVEVN